MIKVRRAHNGHSNHWPYYCRSRRRGRNRRATRSLRSARSDCPTSNRTSDTQGSTWYQSQDGIAHNPQWTSDPAGWAGADRNIPPGEGERFAVIKCLLPVAGCPIVALLPHQIGVQIRDRAVAVVLIRGLWSIILRVLAVKRLPRLGAWDFNAVCYNSCQCPYQAICSRPQRRIRTQSARKTSKWS